MTLRPLTIAAAAVLAPPVPAAAIDIPPGTAPAEVTHRLAYTIPPDSHLASIVGTTTVEGPAITVDRTPATASSSRH